MTLSAEIKRVYASAPSARRYVETLELEHPLFPATFFLTNDPTPWPFLLAPGVPVLFVPVPFAVVLPTVDGKGQQDLGITIDNVGRDAMDAIEAAAEDPTTNIVATYREYLDIENSLPQRDPPLVLALQSITVGVDTITGKATRADVLNRKFPSELYRVDLFPGLDR